MTGELKLVDSTIHGILKPLGFKKKKLLWWRECGEIKQVVGLDKMTYGFPHYNFECGLIVEKFKFPHIPNVAFNGLNVAWNMPLRPTTQEERIWLRSAFEMDSSLTPSEREKAFKMLILDCVLPAFDATDTIEKLRAVLKDKGNPLRRAHAITFPIEDL